MALVLLHPVGLDGKCWQFLTGARLESALRYDMAWHGGRPRPSEPFTLELLADDVVAHVNGPLDVVGLSMGGSVGQYIAIRHPERVRSLMIAASSSGKGEPSRIVEAHERADMVTRSGMPGVVDWALQRWFTPEALATDGHPGVEYARDRLLRDDPEAFAAGWLALGAADPFHRLHEIAAPTSVLHPMQDNSTLESKQEIVEQLPTGRLVVMTGPHMVQLERPDALSSLLLEHLEWVDQQLGT